jgi:DNA-binding transcriptional MocR family regulator
VGDEGRSSMRLSFSHLTEAELETAVERLATVAGSGAALGEAAQHLAHDPVGD